MDDLKELYSTFVVAEHFHAGLCVRVVCGLKAELSNSWKRGNRGQIRAASKTHLRATTTISDADQSVFRSVPCQVFSYPSGIQEPFSPIIN